MRACAIDLLQRIVPLNTALTMPAFRKLLVEKLLPQIDADGGSRVLLESVMLLSKVVSAAKQLINPYVRAIARVVTPQLSSLQPRIAMCALEVVRRLGEVCGPELEPELLMPPIIDLITDHYPSHRRAALNTLGVMLQASGHVVQPLYEQPKMLELLLNALSASQQPVEVRTEAMKLFGIIGAVDPLLYKMHQDTGGLGKAHMPVPADTVTVQWKRSTGAVTGLDHGDAEETELLANVRPSHEDYFPSVAVVTVRRVLRDPALSKQLQPLTQALQALRFIFKSLGVKSQPYLQLTLPVIYSLVSSSPLEVQQLLVTEIHEIAAIVKQHIRPYVKALMGLTTEYWCLHPLLLC